MEIMSYFTNKSKFHICYCYVFQNASGRSHTGRKRQSSYIGASLLPYHEHIFRSIVHEQYYTELETRILVQEKMVELENPGEYSDVVQEIKHEVKVLWKIQPKL